ncbi:probable L-type lectin-domain containing receptor kinase S.5 [Syzygium oleosum]|uniref:probable L-type lectin-domain containing receptor kinase S.5 n=1 Tax=Syzygium oleosum TaxID=219896 RepID=UPI0024BA42D2|nr:probable L-type lectin-domain containing receptor kinase S.5 [Syzygium oleosum]
MGRALAPLPANLTFLTLLLLLFLPLISPLPSPKTLDFQFGPFGDSNRDNFSVIPTATITNGALQVTPDIAGNFHSIPVLKYQSGRILFKKGFKLWDGPSTAPTKLASFNTSFVINIYRIDNTSTPGEGLAFFVAPDPNLPAGNSGGFLGLTTSVTDGLASNHLLAVEFDTFKQDYDPDANHIGLDINSVVSNQTVSLAGQGFQLAPNGTKFFHVWIDYDGARKLLEVYMTDEDASTPTKPKPALAIMTATVDTSKVVSQNSYFGFAASTGDNVELNCVLSWNLTVEELPKDPDLPARPVIGLAAGIPAAALVLAGAALLGFFWVRRRRAEASDPNIVGTLKSLPGTPREFKFRDLKRATGNFDERNKLGQGGFGVVYKGVLAAENRQVAVKKFSRDDLKSKDDFLAELTIINRLRHRHLVPLLGWCHKKRMLLLVYDYMPNGSLDSHIFCGPEKQALEWSHRYKIVSGVAFALHYLHHEYDQKVLHRDLKASNIMLDSDFNARLGDFGLARAIDNEKTSYAELEGVPGTVGYIAPECLLTGKATRESDVFGFGAVILEVVCGQRPWTRAGYGGFQFLMDWVWLLHRDGRILEAVDERLGGEYVVEEARRLLLLGLACSHPTVAERPKTPTITQILSGSADVPRVPPFKPAFVWPSASPLTEDGDTADATPTMSLLFRTGWTPRYVNKESDTGFRNSSPA